MSRSTCREQGDLQGTVSHASCHICRLPASELTTGPPRATQDKSPCLPNLRPSGESHSEVGSRASSHPCILTRLCSARAASAALRAALSGLLRLPGSGHPRRGRNRQLRQKTPRNAPRPSLPSDISPPRTANGRAEDPAISDPDPSSWPGTFLPTLAHIYGTEVAYPSHLPQGSSRTSNTCAKTPRRSWT